MTCEPQKRTWTGDRAVLLVHGVGNAQPGDYASLVESVRTAMGAAERDVAIYQLFYDQCNDWFSSKTQLRALLQQAIAIVTDKIDDAEIGQTMAEVLGDVLFPVLITDARSAVREAYLLQLKQMVQDGLAAGVRPHDQKLSIICHSLGCFHTYEALHFAAQHATHQLQPASNGVVFENVIFMASPVQMIRTVADALGPLVPNKRWLKTVQDDALSIPREVDILGADVLSVKRWITITGSLDPVGGYFFRKRADWAYMSVAGQEPPIVDSQNSLNITTKAELAACLKSSLRDKQAPDITPNNPHSWDAYVAGHQDDLRQWLT